VGTFRLWLVLPRDPGDEASRCCLDGEPEPIEQGSAVRQLGDGDLCTPCGPVGTRRRAIQPRKRHAASILVTVRVLLLACTIAIAIATRAFADGAGVIAASSGDRAAVATAMADAMVGRSRRVVPDAVAEARAALAAGAVPVDTMARFRRVREQVDEGWRAYQRVAVEVAALRLASARTEAEPLIALAGGAEVYADAALRLGAVLGHLGRKQESEAALALALALDPDRPITRAEFSPDVVKAVEAVRAIRPVRQRVRVATSPAGATVRIDGKDVGRSPIEVDVARGQHVIIARMPQHRPMVRAIALDEVPAQVELALDPDDEAARLAGGAELGLPEPGQQALLDATLRYADLDEVVVVAETSRRGGPTLLVQRCAGSPARCSAVVDIGFGDRAGLASAARSAWDAARAGELRYPPSVLGERGGRTNGTRCEICRSPWLWTGVGAALVVGTVVTLVIASSSRPSPIVGIDPMQYLPR